MRSTWRGKHVGGVAVNAGLGGLGPQVGEEETLCGYLGFRLQAFCTI